MHVTTGPVRTAGRASSIVISGPLEKTNWRTSSTTRTIPPIRATGAFCPSSQIRCWPALGLLERAGLRLRSRPRARRDAARGRARGGALRPLLRARCESPRADLRIRHLHGDGRALPPASRGIRATDGAGAARRLARDHDLLQTDDARFAGWHYRKDPTHVIFYREETFHHLSERHGWFCEVPCNDVVLRRRPEAAAGPAA